MISLKLKRALASLVMQHWVGHLLIAFYHSQIPARGFLINVDNPHIPATNAASLRWGMCEKNEITHVQRFLRTDLDVIELGSSLGLTALCISRIQEHSRRLICVEANPYLIATLQQNLQRNDPDRQAVVVNALVDYTGRAMQSLAVHANNLGSAVVDRSEPDAVEVRTLRLEDLLSQYAVGDYALVCDIEGAEAGIIFSGEQTLAHCQQIIIELHATRYEGRAYTPDDLSAQLVARHGLQLVAQHGPVQVLARGAGAK